MGKNQHVVRRGKGGAILPAGSGRDSSCHRTQVNAIERAREAARREKSEVVIHGVNGKIRDKDSYGNDSCPPKDKKH